MREPSNIYAAHGIGCLLLEQMKLDDAKRVFQILKEHYPRHIGAWVNLGHVYMLQNRPDIAGRIYASCRDQFCNVNHNVRGMIIGPSDSDLEALLLGYEGNALFKNGQHERATEVLEIGMRLYPSDYRFARAIAYVSEKHAVNVFELAPDKRTIQDVEIAIRALKRSHRLYNSLAKIRENSHELYKKKADHVEKMLELSEQHIVVQRAEERKQLNKKLELEKKWKAVNERRMKEKQEKEAQKKREDTERIERKAREAEKRLKEIQESWKSRERRGDDAAVNADKAVKMVFSSDEDDDEEEDDDVSSKKNKKNQKLKDVFGESSSDEDEEEPAKEVVSKKRTMQDAFGSDSDDEEKEEVEKVVPKKKTKLTKKISGAFGSDSDDDDYDTAVVKKATVENGEKKNEGGDSETKPKSAKRRKIVDDDSSSDED